MLMPTRSQESTRSRPCRRRLAHAEATGESLAGIADGMPLPHVSGVWTNLPGVGGLVPYSLCAFPAAGFPHVPNLGAFACCPLLR